MPEERRGGCLKTVYGSGFQPSIRGPDRFPGALPHKRQRKRIDALDLDLDFDCQSPTRVKQLITAFGVLPSCSVYFAKILFPPLLGCVEIGRPGVFDFGTV